MTYDAFILSIENDEAPHSMPLYMQALWYDEKGNWQKAHSLIDDASDKNSCMVHAYLHRKEGDVSNADYWYRRAGTTRPSVTLQQEWQKIVLQLLN